MKVVSQLEETRKVGLQVPKNLWIDLDAAMSELDVTSSKTNIIIRLTSDYIEENKTYLNSNADANIIKEKEEQVNILSEIGAIKDIQYGELRREETMLTTILVPVKLWDNFRIVVKRKLGYQTAVKYVIILLIKRFIEKGKGKST